MITIPSGRRSQFARALLVVVLLLAVVGGAGVVTADSDGTNAKNCPDQNPTNAYNTTSDTAVEKSLEGRQEAIDAGECLSG